MIEKTVCLILFLCLSVYSQAQERISIDELYEKHRNGISVSKEIKQVLDENDSQSVLDISQKYLSSEDKNDRLLSYRFLYEVAEGADSDRDSHNAVYYLVDKGLIDEEPMLASSALDYLEELPGTLFDNRTKNRLSAIIIDNPDHYKRIVMLSGRLKMLQLTSFYENRLKNDSLLSKSDQWALQLSMARMGDPFMVNACIQQVNAIGMNDQVVYNLIPDLIYIQSKLITDYLLDELALQNLNCTSADPDNEVAIDCAYRLAEYIAPTIQDFPFKVGASGDLECDNYEQALVDIRAWIAENRDDYKTVYEDE
ncbi:MAG: hypothetical protein MI866_02920 [Bacteroidales bacterium]|nr:hypothetical protein [Bacteroidales bacterium]